MPEPGTPLGPNTQRPENFRAPGSTMPSFDHMPIIQPPIPDMFKPLDAATSTPELTILTHVVLPPTSPPVIMHRRGDIFSGTDAKTFGLFHGKPAVIPHRKAPNHGVDRDHRSASYNKPPDGVKLFHKQNHAHPEPSRVEISARQREGAGLIRRLGRRALLETATVVESWRSPHRRHHKSAREVRIETRRPGMSAGDIISIFNEPGHLQHLAIGTRAAVRNIPEHVSRGARKSLELGVRSTLATGRLARGAGRLASRPAKASARAARGNTVAMGHGLTAGALAAADAATKTGDWLDRKTRGFREANRNQRLENKTIKASGLRLAATMHEMGRDSSGAPSRKHADALKIMARDKLTKLGDLQIEIDGQTATVESKQTAARDRSERIRTQPNRVERYRDKLSQ